MAPYVFPLFPFTHLLYLIYLSPYLPSLPPSFPPYLWKNTCASLHAAPPLWRVVDVSLTWLWRGRDVFALSRYRGLRVHHEFWLLNCDAEFVFFSIFAFPLFFIPFCCVYIFISFHLFIVVIYSYHVYVYVLYYLMFILFLSLSIQSIYIYIFFFLLHHFSISFSFTFFLRSLIPSCSWYSIPFCRTQPSRHRSGLLPTAACSVALESLPWIML